MRTLPALLLLATALTLGGCASVMRVDSQVQSFAQWGGSAVPAGAVTYAFERLPSQASGPQQAWQTELERLTSQSLARYGWSVTPGVPPSLGTPSTVATAPGWTVQVSARTDTLPRAPWEDPRDGFRPRVGLWAGTGGGGVQLSGLLRLEQPYYVRAVSVLVRNTRSGLVVYETSATHDGRWNDTPALWQAIIDSALNQFPLPPQGPRQVNIDIPR